MIRENVKKLLEEMPAGVTLEAASKTRIPDEVLEAIEAGVTIIGENYIQEAQSIYDAVKGKAHLHFIGHLQRNKVKKAVEIFDMIETVDSLRIAQEIDKRSAQIDRRMDVLIEINSGREPQKFGIFPEKARDLIQDVSSLEHIQIMGLMTMGPFTGDPEEARPYFVETRRCFEEFKTLSLPNVEMKYLSMGMTNSFRVAIEEGANIVRIGTKIFGERPY
jgi:pyridoxal phosphate enzyme (YggS family)